MYVGGHVKLTTVNFQLDLKFFYRFLTVLKYQILLKSVHWKPSCSVLTDRQTDMTKLIVAFRSFTKASKSVSVSDRPTQTEHRKSFPMFAIKTYEGMEVFILGFNIRTLQLLLSNLIKPADTSLQF